jgi:hypothetical protein
MFPINCDQSVISEYFGSDKVFVVEGMSFIFKSKDPRCKSLDNSNDLEFPSLEFFFICWMELEPIFTNSLMP